MGNRQRRIFGAGVVVVADEIEATLDLRGVRTEEARAVRPPIATISLLESLHGPRPAEIGVGVVDARVDDRDLDALTMETEVLPDLRTTDVGHSHRVLDRLHLKSANGDNVRERGKRRSIGARDPHTHAVVGGLQLAEHLPTERRDVVLDGVLLGLQIGLDGVLLGLRELGAGLRLADRDGIGVELDHDID